MSDGRLGIFINLFKPILYMDTPKITAKDWSESSSTVANTDYDYDKKTLTVKFKNGTAYEYYDMPEDVWQLLINSQSIGGALSLNVKGHYRYQKIS